MSLFNTVKIKAPKRNKLDLSHQNILTTGFGKLTPCLLEELLPGDTFRLTTEVFTRFQPLMAPVFGRCNLTIHNFFVPSRILYNKFYDFLIDDTSDPTLALPYTTIKNLVQVGQEGVSDLSDYLNVPRMGLSNDNNTPLHLLPFLAYQLVYNEYYRDENLQNDIFADGSGLSNLVKNGGLADAAQLAELTKIRYRSFRKDYFTGALPFAQKGPAVQMPLAGEVTFDALVDRQGNYNLNIPNTHVQTDQLQLTNVQSSTLGGSLKGIVGAAGTTINDLRRSLRVQEYLEAKARGGTRPQEFIKSMWGVNAKDARLQRPEYIGGTKTPIQISEVLSQSSNAETLSETDTQLGRLGGHAKGAGVSTAKKYRASEHGYLISILSVMPDNSYFQGLPRHFSHLDKFDFFTPQLANIGEQEVLNKELLLEHTYPERVFGYVPRYAEYKVHLNEVHGQFRKDMAYWTLARDFSSDTALNESFIQCKPDQGFNRIFTYTADDTDPILIQLYHHNSMLRLMPYFGTPKL